jgi:DNA repair exonuclease SbcCD ATPase subunit
MLKLKRYSFSGIGRFIDKQTIDLQERSHLIQIDGYNTNTGGSSGAGKSTTVEALAFLLGISEIPATQLQSRGSDEPIWVQGEFEGGVTITRCKKEGLTIQTPDETVSGNSKLAEEKLDEIIGVNRDLLKTMCYKRQKQGGFFLNLTPKQSYEFLIQCLDLKDYHTKISKLEDTVRSKYKPRKIELESSIQTLQNSLLQLNALLEQKTKPSPPDTTSQKHHEDAVEAIKLEIQELNKSHTEEMGKIGSKPIKPSSFVFKKKDDLDLINNQISELKILMHKNLTNREAEIEQASSAISKIREKIKQSNDSKIKAVQIDQAINKLLDQKQHLESGNCPTCLRLWESNETIQKLSEIDNQIQEHKTSAELLLKEVAKIPHYKMMEAKAEELLELKRKSPVNVLEEKDLEEYQEKQRVLLNEKQNLESTINGNYLQELNAWNQKSASISETFNQKKSLLNEQLSSSNHELEKINIQKANYSNTLKSYERDCDNIKEKLTSSNQDLQDKTDELNKIEKDILLSEESIRLIKNFTLQKFQDTLNYIGHRATEIINMVPNMANAVIFFENNKETKSGNIKNEVNAIINLESDGMVPIKTLSGGERTSADFAVDLAVSEMIENMTQKGVNFLIIDEGFDGLDSISKIQCLEILKNLNTDKKILIVDHSSEVKEMIYDNIIVKRVGEKSFIQ